MEPFIKSTVIPVRDEFPEARESLPTKIEGLKKTLAEVQQLQIKIKARVFNLNSVWSSITNYLGTLGSGSFSCRKVSDQAAREIALNVTFVIHLPVID